MHIPYPHLVCLSANHIKDCDKVKIETTKTIRMSGSSYTVALTNEVKALGLDAGDLVKITLERIVDGEGASEGD